MVARTMWEENIYSDQRASPNVNSRHTKLCEQSHNRIIQANVPASKLQAAPAARLAQTQRNELGLAQSSDVLDEQ